MCRCVLCRAAPYQAVCPHWCWHWRWCWCWCWCWVAIDDRYARMSIKHAPMRALVSARANALKEAYTHRYISDARCGLEALAEAPDALLVGVSLGLHCSRLPACSFSSLRRLDLDSRLRIGIAHLGSHKVHRKARPLTLPCPPTAIRVFRFWMWFRS